MNGRRLRRAGVIAAAATAGSIALLGTGAQAGEQQDARAKETVKLAMVADGKELSFEGPGKVEKGAKLKIVNETDPKKIGPHTFSFVRKGAQPKTKEEANACGKRFEGVCGRILEAHEVDLDTGQVGKPNVDAGEKGWDATFGKKGDSWVTEAEGEKESREVTAEAGSRLYYLCIVHPEMQGRLSVE